MMIQTLWGGLLIIAFFTKCFNFDLTKTSENLLDFFYWVVKCPKNLSDVQWVCFYSQQFQGCIGSTMSDDDVDEDVIVVAFLAKSLLYCTVAE